MIEIDKTAFDLYKCVLILKEVVFICYLSNSY